MIVPDLSKLPPAFLNKLLSPEIAQSANRASFCGSGSLCGCAILNLWFARFRKTRGGSILGCFMLLANDSFWAAICGESGGALAFLAKKTQDFG